MTYEPIVLEKWTDKDGDRQCLIVNQQGGIEGHYILPDGSTGACSMRGPACEVCFGDDLPLFRRPRARK